MSLQDLKPQHYFELQSSGISDAIIDRYFASIEGEAAQEWLIEDAFDTLGGHAQQYATAPVKRLLEQSEHATMGGWICTANGQIKPDHPRQAIELYKGEWLPVFINNEPKLIKYESKREKPYKGAHVSLMQPIGTPRKTANGQRLVIVTEGAKKAAAAATLGYESIGFPGVDMGKVSGSDELIPVLAKLAIKGATIAIAFDKDKKTETKKGVANSLLRLATALENAGAKVVIPTWKVKDGKGIDDVLVAQGAEFVHDAIAQAEPLKQWRQAQPKSYFKKARPAGYTAELKRIEALHKAYNVRPTADVTLNQRYLDKGKLGAAGSVELWDSPMSTGKTSSLLAGIVEQHRAKHPDAIIISSAYRNILLRQSGEALGITHWLDTNDDPSLQKFGALAACPESLPKLASQKIPAGSLLLIDEVVAWLRHIFTSDTMKNGADRVAVLNAVKDLFSKVVDGGGFVVGLEAGIPQWAVDCLRELMPAETPLKFVRNEFKLKANQKAFFYDNLNNFKAEQIHIVRKGVKICAASDSATQVDRQYRKMFDEPKDFHISAENSADAEAQSFAANPQAELIARDGLRVFSYSPTIGAGVSIDDAPGRAPWFDAKTGIFTHLTSSDASQQLGRYRRSVPVHIYCQKHGNGIGDGDLTAFTPEGLRAKWNEDAKYCHKLVSIAEYLSKDSDESLRKILQRSLDGELAEVATIDKWRSIITAVDNFDKLHLQKNLKAKLEADGYEIVGIECETIPGKAEEFKAIKEQSESEAGKEFAALEVPENMTPDEARNIMSSHGHSRKETLQARKCLYQFEFPKCDFNNPEFCTNWIIKSKGKKLTQLRAEWAARNPEQAKAIDRWHIKGKLKQADNLFTGVSMSDVSQVSPAADMFAKAELPKAIDAIGTELYNNDHPEVARVGDWAQKHKAKLKQVLRMTIDEDRSNLDIFNSLARKLGYKPQAEKQKGKQGQREKQYVLSDFANPDRGHMLKSLSDKFAAKLEQKGESLSGESLKPKKDWGVSYEELETRQAAQAPVPIAETQPPVKPAARPTELYATDMPGDLLGFYFQQDLVSAKTHSELQAAKMKAPEATRRKVMREWEKDGRYEALKLKARQLKELAEIMAGART